MLLEHVHGVVVSRNYADYLDVSLTHNRSLFSHLVVVTTSQDKESQRVAGKHNCTLLVTDDHSKDGKFNKGAMIERGLQQLPSDGWRIHFDADILFPADARRKLAMALHDRQGIYGCDRFNVVGWEAYQKLVSTNWHLAGFHHHHFLSYPQIGTEVGSRLIYPSAGWVPIGYTQIWHASVEYSDIYRTRTYSDGSSNAAHDDVQFALRWDRNHRHLIPEFFVAHLMTKGQQYGENWKGRKTPRFGPPVEKIEDDALDTGSCESAR
jgi:Glycosyl transferase family 2